MEVGWTRVVSAQLDGLLCVEDDELTPTMTVADLKELLRSKLKALGVGVRINPKLIFYDTNPNDSDEITPLMPTLRTGHLRWVLHMKEVPVVPHDGKTVQIFVKTLTCATITLDVLLYSPVYETMQGILKKENIPTDQQRLIYAGMQLEQGRAFNVLAHSAPCPICKQAIEARSRGFYACAMKVGSGMHLGMHMSSDWKSLPTTGGNMVLWRTLLLLVKPLRDEPKCALCKDAIGETTLECKTTCGHMHRGCVDAWVAGSMQRLSVGANCPKCHTSVA